MAPYLWIGSSLAGSLLLCVLGGAWLDRTLGTGSTFLLVGAGVGLLSAGVHFWRLYLQVTSRKQ